MQGMERISDTLAKDPFIQSLARDHAAEAVKGDYLGAGGLLYCGRCNTPKEAVIPFFNGEMRKVICACQCENQAWESARESQREAAKMEHLRARKIELQDAGLEILGTDRYLFENDDGSAPELMNIAHRYVENFDKALENGISLLFCGDLGAGKTFAACCIGNELFRRNRDVVISSFRSIADASWRSKRQDMPVARNRVLQCELLVLDDFGTERCTDYMIQEMFDIIDTREKNQRPIIVTTNLSRKQILEGESMNSRRIADRLFGMCKVIAVKGRSKRIPPARNEKKLAALREMGLE